MKTLVTMIGIACLLVLWVILWVAFALMSPVRAAEYSRTVPFCHCVKELVVQADRARRRGVPYVAALAEAEAIQDPEARSVGRAVIWYVYLANGDGKIKEPMLAQLMERACLDHQAGIDHAY